MGDASAPLALHGAVQTRRSLDIQDPETRIYVYGYYRTDPPRIQWGFLSSRTGIAVVYDMEAELIATVFKPEEGESFFLGQIDAVQINRGEWNV